MVAGKTFMSVCGTTDATIASYSNDDRNSQMRAYLLIYLKGMAMGAADVVPGVSGGTVAFITGIYERLIAALAHIDTQALRLLFARNGRGVWQRIDGGFLLCLFLGIATSVFTLSKVLRLWLTLYPIPVWSFFFGLILASVWFLGRSICWNATNAIVAMVGCVVAVVVSLLPAASYSELGLPYLFLCGACAIMAMILPGISGAFILVLLGAYETVLNAVHDMNITVLGTVALGAVFGLLLFSRVLRWLFSRYHTLTIALMTGFIAGSLVKIWPWKTAGSNIAPNTQIPSAVALMVLGIVLIFVIETLAVRLGKRT